MVSITTLISGKALTIRRVPVMPSTSGIVTSIRTTSGRSCSASRTASSPLPASPTTSKPSSVSERRSVSRSMR